MFISLPLLPSAALHFLQKSEKFSQWPELSLQTMLSSPLPSFLSPLFIWPYFMLRSNCFKEFTLQRFLQGWNSYSNNFDGFLNIIAIYYWLLPKHTHFGLCPVFELLENNFTRNKQWEIVAYFMPPNQSNNHPDNIMSLKSFQYSPLILLKCQLYLLQIGLYGQSL